MLLLTLLFGKSPLLKKLVMLLMQWFGSRYNRTAAVAAEDAVAADESFETCGAISTMARSKR